MAPPQQKPHNLVVDKTNGSPNNKISAINLAASGTACESSCPRSDKRQQNLPSSYANSSRTKPDSLKFYPEASEDILEDFDSDTEELRRVFESFDENADGKLSADEVQKSLAKFGLNMTEKELASTMIALDKNKNGFIDIGEFLSLYKFKLGAEEEAVQEYDEYLKRAFKVFDKNEDGYITAQELHSVLSNLGLDRCSNLVDCRHMIKGVDLNGDGQVDFQEFKLMMSPKCSKCSAILKMKSPLEKTLSAIEVPSYYEANDILE